MKENKPKLPPHTAKYSCPAWHHCSKVLGLLQMHLWSKSISTSGSHNCFSLTRPLLVPLSQEPHFYTKIFSSQSRNPGKSGPINGIVESINRLCEVYRKPGGEKTSAGLHEESIMRNLYNFEGRLVIIRITGKIT